VLHDGSNLHRGAINGPTNRRYATIGCMSSHATQVGVASGLASSMACRVLIADVTP
jgi:hypothetical protein